MTQYGFLTRYDGEAGLFVAETIDEARKIAWESLTVVIPDPDPALFTIRPLTQADLDHWTGPPLSIFEDFSPWPEPSNQSMHDAFVKRYGKIGDPLNEDDWLNWFGIYSLGWSDGSPAMAEELAISDRIIAERGRLLEAIPACPRHGDQCVPHAIEIVEQWKKMQGPGRPMSRTEKEAITAVIMRDDQITEARTVIRLLLGLLPAGSWNRWPVVYERAQKFLKPSPARVVADGDE